MPNDESSDLKDEKRTRKKRIDPALRKREWIAKCVKEEVNSLSLILFERGLFFMMVPREGGLTGLLIICCWLEIIRS
jgi:hypothetical protein